MKKILLFLVMLVFCLTLKNLSAEAASCEAYITEYNGKFYLGYSTAIVEGFNRTHGFSKQLPFSFRVHDDNVYLEYVLPDDGSTWEVSGTVFIYRNYNYPEIQTYFFKETRTTSGTFTGVSIGQAVNAANAANNNAANAKSSADAAKSSADSAKSEATAAKNNAYNANANADAAKNNTWDSAEGKSATTIAKEGRDKANAVAGDTTYIRNTQLPDLENKIASIQTTVNNITNADKIPPSVEVKTLSGAMATSGSSIRIVITASDNVSSDLQYSINGGTYSILPANGIVSAPITSSGSNAVTVRVKDEADNIGSKTIIIRKL